MPTVHVPPPYRGPTGGEAKVLVEGSTLRECLEAVEARYPGFLGQVLDAAGRQHRFVKLFVNGEPAARDALSTAVAQNDDVEVLAAIAGG